MFGRYNQNGISSYVEDPFQDKKAELPLYCSFGNPADFKTANSN